MNDSLPIAGTTAVAAMTPPRSRASFNRAQLVARGADGSLLQVQAYTEGEQVVGSRISEDELTALIEAGQASKLPQSCPLVSGAALWILRPGFPRRDRALQDLRAGSLLVQPPMIGLEDARLCVVNEAAGPAAKLRDRWRDEAVAQARSHARASDWPRAESEAELAQQVARGLDAEALALLSLAHLRCSRAKRAEGLRAMARNSRGAEFEAEFDAALLRFEGELPETSARGSTHPALRELLAARFSSKHLGEPRTARLGGPGTAPHAA